MMEVTSENKEYLSWDNPNEVVDGLRLLLALQTAGYTGYMNEINSQIEEIK